MDVNEFFIKWVALADSVAARQTGFVRLFGWDRDDALQHGRLVLLRWARKPKVQGLPDETVVRLLPTVISRRVRGAAGRRKYILTSVSLAAQVMIEDRGECWVSEFVREVLAYAPPSVYHVLETVLTGGCKLDLGGTRRERKATQDKAARWLLAQYEGVKDGSAVAA